MYTKAFGSGFSPVHGSSSGGDAGGGWSSVSINGNGTFTLPSLGTYPLPSPGEMKKIPLQDGKFFKIRQRNDGSYEGKFGPTPQPPSQPAPQPPPPPRFESSSFQPSPKPQAPEHKAPEHKPATAQPATAPSSGGWSSVSINGNGTFTLPSLGTYPLPAAGELKKIPLQGDKFFKVRQRADGAYEGKFGPDSKPAPQPLPVRLEDRKKDAGGWPQIEVDADGMMRVPGIAQPLYRPMPGQTQAVSVDAKTTFRFRRGEDGDVYGTFETKAPSQPPPGWQRVNVSPDGMLRLPGITQPLYRPQPGQTESVQLDKKTTFKFRQAEDGEVHGTFETKPSDNTPGRKLQESKEDYEGVVPTRQVNGRSMVDVGRLGSLVAPAVGGHDSYLVGLDKLLVLQGRADGTVEVSTRKLGLKNTDDGFKGALLPSDGRLEFAGRVFDVSRLQPGQELKNDIRLDGKKFKVKLRMHHDGSVNVSASQQKSWFEQVLDWAGKIAPFLAPIPGLGLIAVAAKVVTVFNAVKNFAQSLKNGNVLGMVGSAAGAVAGFSQGAVQAFASKVANLANVGQQAITTLKHGLGNGLLQVVSNGANLVSGIAQAAGDLGQGAFQGGAYGVAQTAGNVAGYAFSADRAVNHGDLLPAATQVAQEVAQQIASDQTSDSMGQDEVDVDKGFLVAGSNVVPTPQQVRLINSGVKNFTAEDFSRALRVADNLSEGGTFSLSVLRDGAVTREQITRVTDQLKSAIRRNDYLGLQIFDLNSLGQNPREFYTKVVATLEWMASNFAAFSAQNPVTAFKVGPVNVDLTNSAGRRSLADIEDIIKLKDMGLLKQEAGGSDFQKLSSDFNQQMEARQRATRELLEASKQSGGSGPSVTEFNGRQYGNPKELIGPDNNPYTVYQQLNVPAGQPSHELWVSPVPTTLAPNLSVEFPK